MTDIEKLNNMRQEIEEARATQAQLEGRKAQLLSQIEASFGVRSIEEAKTKLAELDAQYHTRAEKLHKLITQLQGAYEWKSV